MANRKHRRRQRARAVTTDYDQEPDQAAAHSHQQHHGDNSNNNNAVNTTQHDDDALMMKKNVEEADLVTQELNQLGLGEVISYEEFDGYFNLLLQEHPSVDTSTKLNFDQLEVLEAHHEFYRIKYHEWLHQVPGSKLDHDGLIKQCPFNLIDKGEIISGISDFLEKCGLMFFAGKFDWFFHPHYSELAALDDYQRLVPKNVGCRYADWEKYHQYLHTYEVEKDYVKYHQELSKKLKELVSGMNYDVCFFKELDGVYFEIWQRVTKQKMSFRDALNEVYELNRFPLRQNKMKYALENDCSKLEDEFHTCTACVTEQVAEDEVHGLIAEAVKKLISYYYAMFKGCMHDCFTVYSTDIHSIFRRIDHSSMKTI
uniref:Uncharacterized protein n=1 Tax=Leersia perrieri TaxID=77586 RepID=A0A0D9VAT2_9ORYZ